MAKGSIGNIFKISEREEQLSVAKKVLSEIGVELLSYVHTFGPFSISYSECSVEHLKESRLCMPDRSAESKALSYMADSVAGIESIDGTIEIIVGCLPSMREEYEQLLEKKINNELCSSDNVKRCEITKGEELIIRAVLNPLRISRAMNIAKQVEVAESTVAIVLAEMLIENIVTDVDSIKSFYTGAHRTIEKVNCSEKVTADIEQDDVAEESKENGQEEVIEESKKTERDEAAKDCKETECEAAAKEIKEAEQKTVIEDSKKTEREAATKEIKEAEHEAAAKEIKETEREETVEVTPKNEKRNVQGSVIIFGRSDR